MTISAPPLRRLEPPPGDFWIFGYGSLMWDPGFPHLAARPARIMGYHRALCLYSNRYRGTDERPGLVLGLDRGGSCLGRAYLVAEADGPEIARYLDDREMLGEVYDPRWVEMRFPDGSRARAYAYVADRHHPHYAGKLTPEEAADFILQGCGERGTCLDYLTSTVQHMDELGIADSALHELLDLVLERVRRGELAPQPVR
jgi:cation transport protein ChaC